MKIIIVGSVAAGTSVAAKARRNDESAEIIVYERGPDISYSICGIPYYSTFAAQISKQTLDIAG